MNQQVGDFMKTRLDPTPLSARKIIKEEIKSNDPLFEFADEIDDSMENYTTEIEFSEYEGEPEPPIKKQKTYHPPKATRASQIIEKKDNSSIRTIEYTLINEETHDEIQPEQLSNATSQQLISFQGSDYNIEKYKRRSKTFGKYVSALLIDITDDKVFFDLQNCITKSIHEACMKQNEEKKS